MSYTPLAIDAARGLPQPDTVPSNDVLPKAVDHAIIGGGIIGVCAAFALAEQGKSVALFEKGRVAGEQSSRNWGFCRIIDRDLKEIPLAQEALRIWHTLHEKTGADLGFRRTGIFEATYTEKELAAHEDWLRKAQEFDVDACILSANETVERTRAASNAGFNGALFGPNEGRAEPQWAAPRIAMAAQSRGNLSVHQNCAVRSIESKAGRVHSVVTEKGEVLCDSVLLAGGMWSRLMLKALGVTFPQLTVRSSVTRVRPVGSGALPETAIYCPRFGIRPHLDGSISIAAGVSATADFTPDYFRFFWKFLPALLADWETLHPRFGRHFFHALRNYRSPDAQSVSVFEDIRINASEPLLKRNLAALENAAAVFPGLANAKTLVDWAGLIDVTPDAVPCIDEIPALPGLFLASGFSGHGFGIGPGAGYLAADLMTGKTPRVDPTAFAFARFSDGTKLRPMSGL